LATTGRSLPPERCASVSAVANRSILRQTDGVRAFPREVIRCGPGDGLLKQLDGGPRLDFGPVGICHRKGVRFQPAAHALVAALKGQARLDP
jgi:hypothetical protein